MTSVWAVVYGKYMPAEVDSIWETKEDADLRAAELNPHYHNEAWHSEKWAVQSRAQNKAMREQSKQKESTLVRGPNGFIDTDPYRLSTH